MRLDQNLHDPSTTAGACIHELFEGFARARPEAIALAGDRESLSYSQLNARANRLARHLRAHGVAPDVPVALLMPRGVELVVAMLAVLKAGGAYVPFDVNDAPERVAAMLRDVRPAVVLVQAPTPGQRGAVAGLPVLDVVADATSWADESADDLVDVGTRAAHLAYVIHTSGSTGRPKGVMVEHRNVVALVVGNTYAPLGAQDCVAHCANPAFDASTWEVWGALLAGARVHVVAPADVLEPARLARRLRDGGVTALWLTVALFDAYVDELGDAFARLKFLLVGGDALHARTLARLFASGRAPRHVVNGYGPTETTTFATTFEISHLAPDDHGVPIGHPIAGTTVHLLDDARQPVAPGATGEIWIGGAGVARGYLHQGELTAERFVADPFARAPGARMYRTGDLGRRRHDGAIECLGRTDMQVKLRGFRVELGEIESRLGRCEGVREAVVVAREGLHGDKRLVAYVTLAESAAFAAERLRAELAGSLPDYMVPSAIVALAALPRTPNGKLDRLALPAPEVLSRPAYEAPVSELERTLAATWAEMLGTERVGRLDHFFELGGHSLTAARVVARLQRALGLDIGVGTLFSHPTLAAFASALADAGQGVREPIARADRTRPLPLSWAQQHLWFLHQLDAAASRAYHVANAFRLDGALRVDALQWALDRLAHRHESLRTSFPEVDGVPTQRIHPAGAFPLRRVDLSAAAPAERERLAREAMDAACSQAFDLRAGPLTHGVLLALAPDEHVLLLVAHHIVSDGWSVGVMLDEVSALHDARLAGAGDPLPALALQCADHAAWQAQAAQHDAMASHLAYWRRALDGAPALLELPADRPRPVRQSHRGGELDFGLGAGLTQALQQFSRRQGVTLFMTLLAGWSTLLARMSGQDEVVIGTPVAHRDRPELEPLIGFFVNTLALRVSPSGDLSVDQLLAQVRQRTLEAYAHEGVPFARVVEALRPSRGLDHNPLFQAMLALNNTPDARSLSLAGVAAHALRLPQRTTQFDIALAFDEVDGRLEGRIEFALDLFDAERVRRLGESFKTLLAAMVADGAARVGMLPVLAGEERQRVLAAFNDTARPFERDACVHELFEAQAARTPEAVAVVDGARTLTYGALNARANRLAHRLQALGVTPDARVAICTERSADMVVGLLAVLKAGGAYVPLDPVYPAERLNRMLADSAPVALLVSGRTDLATGSLPVLDLHADGPAPEANPARGALQPKHLAYVIYTSGSTGVPKGVMVEHRNVVNLIHAHVRHCALAASDVVLQFASMSFDASVEEIFAPLSVGARIVPRPAHIVGPDESFLRLMREQAITVAELPTAFWHAWALQASPEACDALRLVVVGGEKAERRLLAQWRDGPSGRHSRWLNTYGPTEATVYASALSLDADDALPDGDIPIGRPIANTRIYLLDPHGQPVPIGATGELHIAGAGVARGYLNREALTAEKFVADPFSDEPDARMYRSGDLGRHLADGRIEYLGRGDHQVKIRGFRIELGEIEARLASHASVREAVVLAREDTPGDRRLVAYVTPRDGATPEVGVLRQHLLQALPEHMVPAAVVTLARLPINANGKIDRQALPAPDADAYFVRAYEAPEGEVEQALARIWADVLKVDRVGRNDNFFELGGHSLMAATQMSRLRRELRVDVPLKALFAAPVLCRFAQVVRGATHSESDAIAALPRDAALPLSFAQARLWFLAQMDDASEAYHMPFGLRLSGDLDAVALRRALDRVVCRHESLRARLQREGEEPVQRFAPADCGFALACHNLRGRTAAEVEHHQREEARRPFDLGRGPLIRGQLLRTGDREHLLLITMHHIASDGWSFGVMLNELSALYGAFAQGQADPLPPLPIQYADYAQWQRRASSDQAAALQAAHWREMLQGAPALLSLPTDRPRPPRQSYAGAQVDVALEAGLTAALRRASQRRGMTLYMTLMAAWAVVLARLSGQDDVVIGTTMANRAQAQTEGLIGLFANTQAIRVQTSALTVGELLRQVRTRALDAQQHQGLPFEGVLEALKPARSLAHTAVFQVMMVWQNADAGALRLPGLAVTPASLPCDAAKFDLELDLGEEGDRIVGRLGYATALFDRVTVARHVGCLEQALAALAGDDEQLVERIDLLAPAQRQRVLATFNDTAQPFDRDACVHELFEAQAARTPDAVAVVDGARALRYGELNARANRLAHRLQALGVVPDARVAICTERSAEMVVGLLAILKAGGAYVPLDPVYPAERLNRMLADSTPVALLASGRTDLATGAMPVLDLHADWPAPEANPARGALQAKHLAYVIYTSGSTGMPKGVMVEHRNVVNLVHAHVRHCALTPRDAVLQFASVSFDASVEEIFAPLCVGARIVLRPAHIVGPDENYLRLLREQRVTVAELPTAFWHQWALQQAPVEAPADDVLRLVVVGGEKAERRLLQQWRSGPWGRHSRWLNTYGPTEATVYASALSVDGPEPLPDGDVPIGRPIANTRIYLLDPHGQPVPIGATGELHIAGAGVARGYLNREALTAEKFVADPFSDEPDARMYRSGDLGRHLADGRIEYLGRGDHQVKIRGFRIELGEIEARLASHASVREAVVLAREDTPGDRRLVAYVTPRDGATPEVGVLRQHLLQALPEHMVPAAVVTLARLPINANGKIDRQALPAPDADAYFVRAYEAPEGEVEQALARIWADVLKVDRVGRNDNFFELGGHSLMAIAVIDRMRRADLSTEVRHLFAAPTLAALADVTQEIREIVL